MKRYKQLFVAPKTHQAIKTNAAREGLSIADYVALKLGEEAKSEEKTMRRRYNGVF